MLNYNLNINSPLQQAKKNEDVRPPINWDFHSFASASDSTDLSERTFATMSINTPNTNCIQVSIDSGNSFVSDAQADVTASVTGSNWPITGSTTMSLFTAGITYDPLAVDQYFSASVSASGTEIIANPSISASIITNNFLSSEFYRFYVSGSVVHMKGNVFNPLVNWKAQNQSPVTTTGNINGHTASFNIVKDINVPLVNISQVTGSISSSFPYQYNFGVTASLTASINNATGSTSMSISIPQAGINVSQQWLNETTTEAKLTGSFAASNNNPYNITASVTFNKGNIYNSKINFLVTGSTPDSYSLYTIPAQYNLVKDINVNIVAFPATSSISGNVFNEYAFNQTSSLTGSGQYSAYQVFAYVTESLELANSGSTTLVTASAVQQTLTQKFAVDNIEDYNITAKSFVDKIPALAASIIVIGGGGGGGCGGVHPSGGDLPVASGGGGGAGGFVQHDFLIVPNKAYIIESIGVGGRGATTGSFTGSLAFTGSNGTETTVRAYLPANLVGATTQFVEAIIGADGGYTGSNGSNENNNGGAGGKSGASSYALVADPYQLRNNEYSGGAGSDGSAGGGAGIIAAGQTSKAGINLGGAPGAGTSTDTTLITGSIAPTFYFQSQSFTITGSGGDGGITSSIDGKNATAFGGGGGGGFGASKSGGNGGRGQNGAVIIIYSGSQKLTVPNETITTFTNGFTQHIIKTTGSFSYDYTPVPNPPAQPYQWRAELLVVGGGGCGAGDISGGGGAGGYVYSPYSWFDTSKTYNVTVGEGQPTGSAAPSGSNSFVIDNATSTAIAVANGGGKAGSFDGACGGGGSGFGGLGGKAIAGLIDLEYVYTASYKQGFNGGNSNDSFRSAGGGGGASTTGSAGINFGGGAAANSGAGGLGRYSLDFIPVGLCGGGQGSTPGDEATGSRAFGGGVNVYFGVSGSAVINGIPNTGGGGAGQDTYPSPGGGAGGSGIVQIKYVGTPRATGGQIQTQLASGSYYTLHTFTASGVFSPTN
jgi:hypothetical protein